MITAGMRIRPGESEQIACLLRDGWQVMNGGADQDNQPTLFCCREYQHWDQLAAYGQSHGYAPPRQIPPSVDLPAGSALAARHVMYMSAPTSMTDLGQLHWYETADPPADSFARGTSDTAATPEGSDARSSDTTVTLAMLNALNCADREEIARTYLASLVARQDWRGMADKDLLIGLRELLKDPQHPDAHSKLLTELTEEMLRAKSGLNSKQHAAFLQKGVELAGQIEEDTKTWRKLAWLAIGLLLFGIATSIAFTSWGFILVSDSKLKGYELVVLIFVLALVAISPSVLLLLQRPLKGMDDWSPSAMKVRHEKNADDADGGNDAN